MKKLADKLEARRLKMQKQKMNIGSIVFNTGGNDKDKPSGENGGGDAANAAKEPTTVKNVVFNVRSLRALQNNIGVFSI